VKVTRWMPVRSFQGYEVSECGQVRSWRTHSGSKHPRKEPLVLRHWQSKTGYHSVSLCDGKGKRCSGYVHRMVLEAFVGTCPDGMEARHLNGDPSDNRVENLCWGTKQEQTDDKRRHGTVVFGELVKSSKLTTDDVRAVHGHVRDGMKKRDVAKAMGVSPSVITDISNGKSWRHVPCA
jgi:hypothetical protein